MSSLELSLRDGRTLATVTGVTSFVGEDPSGAFGIMAGHDRFITSLVFGLARFRCGDAPWRYLALPGGLLYFAANHLRITTRRFLIDENYDRISGRLQAELLAEERILSGTRASLRQMEEELLRRLWQLGRGEG